MDEGDEHSKGAQNADGVTGDRSRQQEWRLIGHPTQGLPTRQGEDHVIGGGKVPVGAGLTEVGKRCHHQLWVCSQEDVRAESESVESPRCPRLNNYVSVRNSGQEGLPVSDGLRILQV
jgi:hypothetical protein